jgi:hypothetical protein
MHDVWLPELNPLTSQLLQEALDDRFFRIWTYMGDGPYALHQEVKDEIESYIAEIVKRNGADLLVELALNDGPLLRGSTMRGPKPFDTQRDGARVAAWRQLELLVQRTRQELASRAVYDPSICDRTYATVPGLFGALDKRFLLPLSPENVDDEFSSDPLVLFGDHALFAHPFLRPYRELIADLMALALDETLDVRIAVDPHAVTPRAARPHCGLFDYWFGVRVDQATLDDPQIIGRTRHERRVDRHDLEALPLLAIDVIWSIQDDLKVLEITETVPADTHEARGGLIFNRYLHAIRDWRRQRWIHVDGAVKAHQAVNYQATRDDTSAAKGPVVAYRKLWRIDGQVSDEDWGRLLGHHFRENELVAEYFGSVLDERTEADVNP